MTPSVLDAVAGIPTYPQTSPGKSDHSTEGGEEGITEVVAILARVGLAHIGGDKTNLCKKVPFKSTPKLNGFKARFHFNLTYLGNNGGRGFHFSLCK